MHTTADGRQNPLTEARLKAIWEDVLRRQDIGLHDDFSELDGDSLSAMLCISRIRDEFAVDLNVDDFFILPTTITSMAVLVDRNAVG